MSPNVTTSDPEILENRTLDELKIGDSACLVRQLTEQDIQLFAVMSGDVNPAHVDHEYARDDQFHQIIGHGMWTGSLISTPMARKQRSVLRLSSPWRKPVTSVVPSARSSSITLPWRTPSTPSKPSAPSAWRTASPCGSRTPCFSMTVTVAFMGGLLFSYWNAILNVPEDQLISVGLGWAEFAGITPRRRATSV